MSSHTFFASAPRHLGSLLAEELQGMGLTDVAETRGGARFKGDLEEGYRACLWSRVANRILLPLFTCPADGIDELYAQLLEFTWEEHFGLDATFAVQFDGVLKDTPNHHYATLRVKDAIADRFRARFGQRPDVDQIAPDLVVHVHAFQGEATVSINLSGTSMHKRGYHGKDSAPGMKENLAAALLLRAGWPEIAASGGTLIDPLCASGTLIIEGALIAADIAPGLLREHLGCRGWSAYDGALWSRLIEEARARRIAGLQKLPPLRGCDPAPQAIRAARRALAQAGLEGRAVFTQCDLDHCAPTSTEETGLVMVNPPYAAHDHGDQDLPGYYAHLGEVLRKRFTGWRASLLTDAPEFGKRMGLRAERMHSLYNGSLECKLLHFNVTPEQFVSNQPQPLPPEELGDGAQGLLNRILKNLKSLKKWRQNEGVDCFRVYDADIPEYAFAIDVYGDGREQWANVQEYAPPGTVDPRRARYRVREALSILPEALKIPADHVFYKVRRPQKGSSQYERLAETNHFHEVQENGLRFLVNFEDYLDTGLFLDHRDIRKRIGELASGKRFLNLFSYTATATVYAARGGARSTITVDMSRTYLDWAMHNLQINGVRGSQHTVIRADCLQWLEQARGRHQFDLIFLDPPSFSTSKRMAGTLDIQRDHVALIQATARLLDPKGVMIFSNNRRRFRLDEGALANLEIRDITAETMPRDFARNPQIHACWQIRRPT